MLPSAVLVVDPSPITANRVREALAGSGLDLVIAVDRVQADAALKRPDLGLLLVASHFPGGEGYEFARAAHRTHDDAVIYLLCGSNESFDGDRAAAAGVDGPIVRPFSVETVRRHIEAVYGPLTDDMPVVDVTPMDVEPVEAEPVEAEEHIEVDVTEVGDDGVGIEEPPTLEAEAVRDIEPEALPSVGDERVAAFVPRDWRTHPPVKVDPKVVGPAIERAILEVLPEVVEVVLAKAFTNSRSFRDLLAVAVDEAVREQLPGIARKVIRERLAELESTGEDGG